MHGLTFTFEELPLIVENGFEAGLVSGEAEITYHDNGEWFVHEIYLQGYKSKGDSIAGFERRMVEIDRDTELHLNILDRLERGRFADSITDMVSEELADSGVSLRAVS